MVLPLTSSLGGCSRRDVTDGEQPDRRSDSLRDSHRQRSRRKRAGHVLPGTGCRDALDHSGPRRWNDQGEGQVWTSRLSGRWTLHNFVKYEPIVTIFAPSKEKCNISHLTLILVSHNKSVHI